MKRCPFCAEEIQDAAIICRFCQRDLPAPAMQLPAQPPPPRSTSAATGDLPATWHGKSFGTAVGCPVCGATVRVGDRQCARCKTALPEIDKPAISPPVQARANARKLLLFLVAVPLIVLFLAVVAVALLVPDRPVRTSTTSNSPAKVDPEEARLHQIYKSAQFNRAEVVAKQYDTTVEQVNTIITRGNEAGWGNVPLGVTAKPTSPSSATAPTPYTSRSSAGAALTAAQRNAVRSAQLYLKISGFSRQGLIDQLSSEYGEQFSVGDATVAVESLNIDWDAQAARSAAAYLKMSGFSCRGLIEQLSSEHGDKYTVEQATNGAKQAGGC